MNRLTDSLSDGHTRKQNASGTEGFRWQRLKKSQEKSFGTRENDDHVIHSSHKEKSTCLLTKAFVTSSGDSKPYQTVVA